MIRSNLEVIAVMGVSGSGKTTIGQALAARLGWPFQDADDLHPRVNILKMAAGHPLTDADRAPWLAALQAWVSKRLAGAGQGVLACSLLHRAYRDQVLGGDRRIGLIFLQADLAILRARMLHRAGHFMPATLLDSQLEALEPPTPDEHPIVIDVSLPPGDAVAAILHALAGPARP